MGNAKGRFVQDRGARRRRRRRIETKEEIENEETVEKQEKVEEKVSTTMLLDNISRTPKAMHNALKKLMEYNLIKIDGKRGMMLSSTPLGKYILNTEYNV